MRRTAALIVGGGPAGAAAAIGLARRGDTVELLERSRGPRDLVCGGFLGWDALSLLRQCGLNAAALGAHPITRLRVVTNAGAAEADLPHLAAGLSRRTLDEALLARAAEQGAVVRRGVSVRSVDPDERAVRLSDGQEIVADRLYLATGKHELRGAARPIADRPLAAGLRAAMMPRPADRDRLAGFIELHPLPDGYAGLLLQEDGSANLCLSVAQERMAGGSAKLLAVLAREAPALGRWIEQAEDGWAAIAGVPYGWRARGTEPGLFRLGDQGAVIASLAGDGVAIALASGLGVARGGPSAPAFQRRFARRAARPLAVAGAIKSLAEAPAASGVAARLLRFVPGAASVAARLTRIGARPV